jgi:hypothetical protein
MGFIRLLISPPRPSALTDMPATVNRFLCRKGYTAITLFGRLFTREEESAARLNKKYDALKNHEMIHLRQAQDTGNSWYRFYWLYLWYSFKALWFIRKYRKATYYLNPFEMEAYCHMYDLHYLESTGGKATEWRKFAKMSLAARLRYIRKNNIG